MTKSISVAEAKSRFSELVNRAAYGQERFLVVNIQNQLDILAARLRFVIEGDGTETTIIRNTKLTTFKASKKKIQKKSTRFSIFSHSSSF